MARAGARRLRFVMLFALVFAVVGITAASAATPTPVLAAPPLETCNPGDSGDAQGFVTCGTSDGGGGFLNLGGLLPLVGAGVVGGLVVLVVAFLVLERRTTRHLAPAEPGEWWTCRNCGKNNVVGSPRCYACGNLQG